jgi:hypothetical protein
LDEGQVDDLARNVPSPRLDVDDIAVDDIGGQEGHADTATENRREVAAGQLARGGALSQEPVTGP